jgi:hypothetical protein
MLPKKRKKSIPIQSHLMIFGIKKAGQKPANYLILFGSGAWI